MIGRGEIALGIACGLCLTACSSAGRPSPPSAAVAVQEGKGALTTTEVVTAAATVEAIDQKSRMVTLLTADGERLRFRVGDEVQNLKQVKKGDQVNVTYYESVALRLRKPGDGTPGVAVAEEAERARPGDMPAGAVAEVVTVTATVRAVDRRKQTVTLDLPNKEKLVVKVKDPKRFDQVKAGDLVEATYREAIAVTVDKVTAP